MILGLTRFGFFRGLRGPPRPARGQAWWFRTHEGLKAAITKVLGATWQRCRVHFMRNPVAHAGKTRRRIPGPHRTRAMGTRVSAWIGTAFAEADAPRATAQWRQVADQLRPRVPRLAALMDDAEADVLAYMGFPAAHRARIHSNNPLERLNGEIKRRTMSLQTPAPFSGTPPVGLPPVAA